MPACWLKPTSQLPVNPMACRNLAANNRVQHHCDPGGQKCTGSTGPLRGPFLQLLQNGTEVKSGTRNDYTGFCSVSSQCLDPFYPIFLCADVTNTAPWIDQLSVSYRPVWHFNGPSSGWTDHLECSPAFQSKHLLWKYISFPLQNITSYTFIMFFFIKICS